MTKDYSKYTPMMQQYLSTKDQYPNCLLFFRLGDFYELFFEDAILASRELDITLTKRGKTKSQDIPMCGVPYHVADQYLAKLVAKGYHVAICDQVEDPKLAQGIVKRDVIRVVTPGTFTNEDYMEADENRYLACLNSYDQSFSLVFLDYSTGEFFALEKTSSNLEEVKQWILDQLGNRQVKEVLLLSSSLDFSFLNQEDLSIQKLRKKEPSKFLQDQLSPELALRLEEVQMIYPLVYETAYQVLNYVYQTQKASMGHILSLDLFDTKKGLVLDEGAKKNLEIFESLARSDKEGSLYQVLNRCQTAMGSRLLRQWLHKPLGSKEAIQGRLDFVEAFRDNLMVLDQVKEDLKGVYDLKRLSVKIATGSVSPHDLISLKNTLVQGENLRKTLEDTGLELFQTYGREIPNLLDLVGSIENTLKEDAPSIITESIFIKEGVHEDLDQLIQARDHGREWILRLEQEEKDRTGIKNLRIKFNKILGYFIEVRKSNLDLVPEDYVRKQTLVSSERFFTVKLKEMESKLLTAKEDSLSLQRQIFQTLKDQVKSHLTALQKTAEALSQVDVWASLASLAIEYHYVRPQLNTSGEVHIVQGRHPIVEARQKDHLFVANDTDLNLDDRMVALITGPNMAGKSTYMRQVALICILAHIGSFVPADQANIPILDRIFTRIGASDNLSGGESTFMVEMKEVATITKYATPQSLIILDEVGRGTGTFDGLSIAWALIEYITDHIGAKTLFASHYLELVPLAQSLDKVFNLRVLTEETEDEILFLRKIEEGFSNQSFGIDVAKLAGIDDRLILRAREVFLDLKKKEGGKEPLEDFFAQENPTETKRPGGQEMKNLSQYKALLRDLEKLDILGQSPLESLQEVQNLQKKAGELLHDPSTD